MSDWDSGTIFSAPQAPNRALSSDFTRDIATRAAREFIRTFQRDEIFPYRESLIQNYKNGQLFIELHLGDVKSFNSRLHDAIVSSPGEFLPLVEKGAREALISLLGSTTEEGFPMPSLQVLLVGELIPTNIRTISAADVNKLLLVPGIIISASRTKPKATSITIRCKGCGTERELACGAGFSGVQLPRVCSALRDDGQGGGAAVADAKCPFDPFVIVTSKCTYIDQQTLKLQEAPETVSERGVNWLCR